MFDWYSGAQTFLENEYSLQNTLHKPLPLVAKYLNRSPSCAQGKIKVNLLAGHLEMTDKQINLNLTVYS